jgi:hypothetical protein
VSPGDLDAPDRLRDDADRLVCRALAVERDRRARRVDAVVDDDHITGRGGIESCLEVRDRPHFVRRR